MLVHIYEEHISRASVITSSQVAAILKATIIYTDYFHYYLILT